MLSTLSLLMNSLSRQTFEAKLDLFLSVATIGRVCVESPEHSHDAPAFLAPATRTDPLSLNMRRMARYLIALQFWVPFDEDLFDQELGKGAQDGKLADSPSFSVEIAREDVVEEATLVVEAAVVGNPPIRRSSGRIELVPDEETADTPLFQDGE